MNAWVPGGPGLPAERTRKAVYFKPNCRELWGVRTFKIATMR